MGRCETSVQLPEGLLAVHRHLGKRRDGGRRDSHPHGHPHGHAGRQAGNPRVRQDPDRPGAGRDLLHIPLALASSQALGYSHVHKGKTQEGIRAMQTDGHWPYGRDQLIACECGWIPAKRAARMSMQHVAHMAHRRKLGLRPVEYTWPGDRYVSGLSTGGFLAP